MSARSWKSVRSASFTLPDITENAPGEEIMYNFAEKMCMDIAGPFRDGKYLLWF